MIPQDKIKHLIVGLVLSVIFINIHIWGGFIFVTLVLAGKELVWDYALGKGTPEWMDFVYGFVPTVLILITKLL